MNPMIASLFDVVQMNRSRSMLVYEQTLARAEEVGDGRLRELVERGIVAADEVRALDKARKVQRQGRAEDAGDRFDTAMDDAVRVLVRSIIDMHDFMVRTDHAARPRVAQIVAAHFPVGPSDLISQRYEEQLDRVRALVADLRGPFADLLGELEVERKLERVEALVAPYAEALKARKRVTGAEVREASRVMNGWTLVMVSHIIAAYHEQPEVFESLLLPFSDQQERIRVILRSRHGAGDDPSRDDDLVGVDEVDAPDEAEAPDEVDGADEADGPDEVEAADDGADGVEAADEGGAEGDDPLAGLTFENGYWYDKDGQAHDEQGRPLLFTSDGVVLDPRG